MVYDSYDLKFKFNSEIMCYFVEYVTRITKSFNFELDTMTFKNQKSMTSKNSKKILILPLGKYIGLDNKCMNEQWTFNPFISNNFPKKFTSVDNQHTLRVHSFRVPHQSQDNNDNNPTSISFMRVLENTCNSLLITFKISFCKPKYLVVCKVER